MPGSRRKDKVGNTFSVIAINDGNAERTASLKIPNELVILKHRNLSARLHARLFSYLYRKEEV